MNPWLAFIVCFFVTAFVGIAAAALKGMGYAVGPEDGEEQ
jgi:ABC-type uncharacterized transport system permease subunit